MTKHQQMQALIRHYKDETGKKEIEMSDVAAFAVAKGWRLPVPADPLELLAKEFSAAAREEIKHDKVTGKPYRVNHAVTVARGNGKQMTFWVDIDEAPRRHMHNSLVRRREQMVGDGLQLSLDQDHWNSVHPHEEKIDLPLDLTPDVEWRKNAPDEDEKTG